MELLHVLVLLQPADTQHESQCFLHKNRGSGGRSTYTVTSLFILMLEFQFRGNFFTSFINTLKDRQKEGWDLLRKEGRWEKASQADQSEEG